MPRGRLTAGRALPAPRTLQLVAAPAPRPPGRATRKWGGRGGGSHSNRRGRHVLQAGGGRPRSAGSAAGGSRAPQDPPELPQDLPELPQDPSDPSRVPQILPPTSPHTPGFAPPWPGLSRSRLPQRFPLLPACKYPPSTPFLPANAPLRPSSPCPGLTPPQGSPPSTSNTQTTPCLPSLDPIPPLAPSEGGPEV